MSGDGLEIERKFLVELTSDPAAVDGARILTIRQDYLVDVGTGTRRVRRTEEASDVRYHQTSKVAVAPGIRLEDEREIDEAEWTRYLTEADPASQSIAKTRYAIPGPDGRTWEIDVFDGALAGLVVAEVELESAEALAEEATPPPCIRLVADVTDDGRYTNAALARLSLDRPWIAQPGAVRRVQDARQRGGERPER